MAEFSLIERFCTGIGAQHSSTKIGVGDDAAVVSIPPSMELAISVDTMVAGVHFYPDVAPQNLAHKLLAVNLSDLAAMGAEPKWATMTLTTPTVDSQWLEQFSVSLDAIAKQYGVQLIGGDTTQGQLNLSIQIMGLLPQSKALTRRGAEVGDDVYVSNVIGDPALALHYLQADKDKSKQSNSEFNDLLPTSLLATLEQPTPQLALGQGLLELANSCIDISDGLVADLSHIAQQSNVSIQLAVNDVPVSEHYQRYLDNGGDIDLALTGGDDYQLAFTVPTQRRALIDALANDLALPITRIGQVTARVSPESRQPNDLVALFNNGQPYELGKNSGYEHFQ